MTAWFRDSVGAHLLDGAGTPSTHPNPWDTLGRWLDQRDAITPAVIYCGGVSTGEEAYSVALMLESRGINGSVIATDIDPELIELAQLGEYPRSELISALLARELNQEDLRGVARLEQDPSPIRPCIRDRVTFTVSDLRRDSVPSCSAALVRNVWRHLSPAEQEGLAARVHDALDAEGLLMIGYADIPQGGESGESAAALTAISRYFNPMTDDRFPILWQPREHAPGAWGRPR